MGAIKNTIMYLLFTYPFGIFIGISFWLLRFLNIARVQGWKNFPHWQGKVLVVSNHPSLLEPIILVGLFFHQYFWQPFKYAPWNLPDKKNYYNNPMFYLMRPRLIPIDRSDKRGAIRGLIQAKNVLNSGGVIIIFPEGGRTYKGNSFLTSQTGKKIRRFTNGFAWLAEKTGAMVLPVWVEGTDQVLPNTDKIRYFPLKFWKRVTIKLGRPIRFNGQAPEAITRKVETTMLELADQVSD